MGYFDQLKTDFALNLQCLEKDIDSLISRVVEEKHSESLQLLRRYVEHTYTDVLDCTTTSFTNWKTLVYGAMIKDDYESCLSDYTIRFGLLNDLASMSYPAVEKLCEEIWWRAGYKNWKKQPSVIVFGGIPYSTNMGLGLTRLRTTDAHRLWNWGILGHELGHTVTRSLIKVIKKTEKPAKKIKKMKMFAPSPEQVLLSWQFELLADAFGLLAVGPCILFAHMMVPRLWCFMEPEEPFLRFFSRHPPDETRYQIMYNILRDNGFNEVYFLKEMGLKSTKEIRDMVTFEGMAEGEEETFEDRLEDVESITPQLWNWLEPFYTDMKERISIFSKENWCRSLKISEHLESATGELPDSSMPSEILNGLLCVKTHVKCAKEEKKYTEKALHLFDSVKSEHIPIAS